jgi:uncharacterized cofD-like protein
MLQGELTKVVVIGGGTGLATILRGLKKENIEITAIVTVADDGGSSGILREEMNMPPPGDIRNVLVSLAEKEPLIQSLFQHRFKNGNGLAGHSLGNLLIAGMQEITGDFVTAIKALSKVLAVRGTVLPAANRSIQLVARMTDGSIVRGESNIPKVAKKVDRISLEPENIEALPEAVQAIEEADLILVGPGSLYTSIIPNLLVSGIQDALKRSTAEKIYVANVMTQPGETDGYDVREHIQAIYEHMNTQLFTRAIVNNGLITSAILQKYEEKGSIPVVYEEDSLAEYGIDVIKEQLFQIDDYLRHDAEKVTEIVMKCIKGMEEAR